MDAGVPVVPGTKEPVYDAETGKKLAEEIGYPVMIKASSGGGGKGMRVAANEDEFEFQFNMAQRESANAFGDDTMYIERFCRKSPPCGNPDYGRQSWKCGGTGRA